MGVLNVTPDSFSGDGLLAAADPVAAAVEQARRMVADGADLLDVGGASTRPGHDHVDAAEEAARVIPVVRALAAALPATPISIDTTTPAVAEAALDAGAHLLNDVWGVADDPGMVRVAARRGVPIVLMHNRAEPRYANVVAEVVADLQSAIGRALDAGVPWEGLIVDPGFGFGKTPDHNLALLASLGALRVLGRPVLLGTSRKSTLGRLLDLPADQRRRGDARDHGPRRHRRRRPRARPRRPRERAGGSRRRRRHPRLAAAGLGRGDGSVTDRIILDGMAFEGTHGVYPEEQVTPQRFEVDVELALNLQPAGLSDDLAQTLDYGRVFETCRQIVESTRFDLIEALAEAIAHEILAEFAADEVIVRVRKPQVRLGGTLRSAGVEIRRRRTG